MGGKLRLGYLAFAQWKDQLQPVGGAVWLRTVFSRRLGLQSKGVHVRWTAVQEDVDQ